MGGLHVSPRDEAEREKFRDFAEQFEGARLEENNLIAPDISDEQLREAWEGFRLKRVSGL